MILSIQQQNIAYRIARYIYNYSSYAYPFIISGLPSNGEDMGDEVLHYALEKWVGAEHARANVNLNFETASKSTRNAIALRAIVQYLGNKFGEFCLKCKSPYLITSTTLIFIR